MSEERTTPAQNPAPLPREGAEAAPSSPIIVDAPPDEPEFGVVEIPTTGPVGPILQLIQDLEVFFKV